MAFEYPRTLVNMLADCTLDHKILSFPQSLCSLVLKLFSVVQYLVILLGIAHNYITKLESSFLNGEILLTPA